MSGAQRLRIGEWIVEPSIDSIRRGGQIEKLEPRTMTLLLYLARRAGEVVSSEELLASVWSGLVVTQDSVYRGIAQLRRHFDGHAEESAYIATIPRKGYRLIAPVEWLSGDPAATALASKPGLPAVVPDFAPSARADPRPEPPPPRPAMRRWIRAALALLVVAAGAGYWLVPSDWLMRLEGQAPAIKSVAVLPFVDRSSAGNNTAFCDGLTDEINTAISHLPGLKVVARSSIRAIHDADADPRTIGKRLNVTHLLEGSVRREGARLRVTAELIDSRTGIGIWSQTFDRSSQDVLDVQEDIARGVADQLALSLSAEADARLAARPTTNVNAYEEYLLGRYERAQNSPAANAQAIAHFRRAIELDSRFARAYVGQADADIAGYYLDNVSLATVSTEAEPLIARALELDSLAADAYATRGWLRSEQGRLAEAEADLERAVTLNPNLAAAYVRLAVALEYDGRPRDALDPLRHAAEIDPLNGGLHVRWCLVLQNLALFDEAAPECERARELGPANSNATWATALLRWAQGDTGDAVRWYDLALSQAPQRLDLLAQKTTLLLDLGRIDEAAKALDAAGTSSPQITLSRAEVSLAREDLGALHQQLVGLLVPSGLDTEGDLRAAALALESGDSALARRFAERATASPGFNEARLMNVWHVRWARSDALTLALVARSRSDITASARMLGDLQAYLDRLQANGHMWSGLQYLRACVLAQEGALPGARDALARARALGWQRAWWAAHDPALAPLARDTGFRDWLKEGGPAPAAHDPLTRRRQPDGRELRG